MFINDYNKLVININIYYESHIASALRLSGKVVPPLEKGSRLRSDPISHRTLFHRFFRAEKNFVGFRGLNSKSPF